MIDLESKFPHDGVLEYEVHGQALNLASRYESFRKQLFPCGVPGHLITLHEGIFQKLPPHLCKNFIEVNLKEAKLSVRDDGLVRSLYYCVIKPAEVLGKQSS